MATLAVVVLIGCAKTETGTATMAKTETGATTPGTSAPAGTTGSSPGTLAAGAAGTITVKTFTFKPNPIRVKAGEKVTWQNEDDILHEPTPGTPGAKGNAFTPVELDGKGSSATVTIATPGTYPYFCAVHESMVGEIVVT